MGFTTHEVTNQVPELADYNLYLTDPVLQQSVQREGAQWRQQALTDYGAWLGLRDTFALAHLANRHEPELEAFDRWGRRVDRVHFNPGWRRFMSMAFRQGMHSSHWFDPRPGAHVARAATYLLHGQVEAGTLCPITMTAAAIPVLRNEPLFESIAPRLRSFDYDGRDLPLSGKSAMTIGMGMTEKQGGSDLRSNTTRAVPAEGRGEANLYRLIGHKWFFSAPTSDAHLVLAKDKNAFSCFYVPRWRPDGSRNTVRIQRLKDKMGNRSNASAEAEFDDALGVRVGEEGRGIATLVEMATYTRLDCVLGSTALIRQALVQALHHARHRRAFGQALIAQPLMKAVLMDIAIESEAATMLALHLARALDEPDDLLSQACRRILIPAAKYWICKRAIQVTAECMEVWGGNGYIENAPMARLYREAPVNSIWEGSGNVMCLDVLRAFAHEPDLADVLCVALLKDSVDDALLKESANRLFSVLSASVEAREPAARYIAQELVLLVQANLMRRHAPQVVADAFIRTRFGAARATSALAASATQAASGKIFERAWQTA